jgi:ubiquinone/menaquinone biosynthesis C-methylase UbiE
VTDDERRTRFDSIAPTYEAKTQKQEWLLGIGRLRRKMLKEARGSVLEVGAGTGTNVALYPAAPQVTGVLMCDRSAGMARVLAAKIENRIGYAPERVTELPPVPTELEVLDRREAERKRILKRSDELAAVGANGRVDAYAPSTELAKLQNAEAGRASGTSTSSTKKVSATHLNNSSTLIAPEDEEPLPALLMDVRTMPLQAVAGQTPIYRVGVCSSERLPFPDSSFDTVVDVFGLCSFDDPVRALTEMSRVCKPDGQVLLLEHGRGKWARLNMYLDKWAPRHAKSWGCWWNRDIRRYVRLSGLHVTSREEKQFGTTTRMTCKPYKPLPPPTDVEMMA